MRWQSAAAAIGMRWSETSARRCRGRGASTGPCSLKWRGIHWRLRRPRRNLSPLLQIHAPDIGAGGCERAARRQGVGLTAGSPFCPKERGRVSAGSKSRRRESAQGGQREAAGKAVRNTVKRSCHTWATPWDKMLGKGAMQWAASRRRCFVMHHGSRKAGKWSASSAGSWSFWRMAVKKRGIEVVARYFHVGQTGLHPKGSVMLDMLRAAKRGDFEWIVVENFGKFPRCPQQDIPPLCLYSMREGRQKRVGKSRSRLIDIRIAGTSVKWRWRTAEERSASGK